MCIIVVTSRKTTDFCLVLSPQATDKHGLTPLMYACFEDHKECAKILLEKVGATISLFINEYASPVSFTLCLLTCQTVHSEC